MTYSADSQDEKELVVSGDGKFVLVYSNNSNNLTPKISVLADQ